MNNDWAEKAYQKLIEVAEKNLEFKPDLLWYSGLEKPEEARALGPVMARGRRDGIIEKTGRVGPTAQAESHGTDVTIWRSLIYKSD